MQTSFAMTPNDGEDGSVLCVASVLLSFRLDFQTDSGGTKHVSLQYMESPLPLDKAGIELS